jgi:hypothetical protein
MNARRLLLVFVMPFLLVFALSVSANSGRNARSTQLRPVSTAPAQYDPLTFRAFVGRRQIWRAASLDPTLFPRVRLPAGSALPATASRCDPAGDITPAGDSVLFNALLCYSGGRGGCAAVAASQGPDGRWWRSPLHIGWEDLRPGSDSQTSFSRDHVLGAFCSTWP